MQREHDALCRVSAARQCSGTGHELRRRTSGNKSASALQPSPAACSACTSISAACLTSTSSSRSSEFFGVLKRNIALMARMTEAAKRAPVWLPTKSRKMSQINVKVDAETASLHASWISVVMPPWLTKCFAICTQQHTTIEHARCLQEHCNMTSSPIGKQTLPRRCNADKASKEQYTGASTCSGRGMYTTTLQTSHQRTAGSLSVIESGSCRSAANTSRQFSRASPSSSAGASASTRSAVIISSPPPEGTPSARVL